MSAQSRTSAADQPRKPSSASPSASPPRTLSKAVSIPSQRPSNEHFDTVVTIEVGPEKKVFVVHKELLCFYSDYFRAPFDGSFKEAIEGKLTLPDENIDTFYLFDGFLYTNQLRNQERASGSNIRCYNLSRLWVFGDKYLVPALQNMAMDCLVERLHIVKKRLGSEPTMSFIYDNTVHDSPLRRMAIDWQVYGICVTDREQLCSWPREAVVDLAMAQSTKETMHYAGKQLPESGKCHYHLHAEGEFCEV
ncbi:unnamed protein product [Aureobasidium uvarum]|uniref:BTB domain-containing protein n=1 Tax=Aureobasidium uvarum TaxID=2773716 RepID=A0A9N8PTW5_9PEZI|nr:unnamed protein product [Aureobasidium uvarum]